MASSSFIPFDMSSMPLVIPLCGWRCRLASTISRLGALAAVAALAEAAAPVGLIMLACCTGAQMTTEERARMNSLCLRIQEEKDYSQFQALLRELNELVGRKELRFPRHGGIPTWRRNRPWKTVSGAAQKIIKNIYLNHRDNVEIALTEAEDLYREIRIENTFTGVDGQPVALKQGARVDVTFEANPEDTVKQGADRHTA
jgi:hypothetical protein